MIFSIFIIFIDSMSNKQNYIYMIWGP